MAIARGKLYGLQVELSHAEAEALRKLTDKAPGIVNDLANGISAVAPSVAPVAKQIADYISKYCAAESALIKFMDKGCGIYLTLATNFILVQMWWAWVPTTRPCRDGDVPSDDEDDAAAAAAAAEAARQYRAGVSATNVAVTTLLA